MTHLFADPADVLIVRDGRPFSAGDDHLATGPFPPPPSAVYGALRSAYLAHAGADFRAPDFGLSGPAARALGTQTETGALALTGLALGRRRGDGPVDRLWPVPLHVVQEKACGAGPAVGDGRDPCAPPAPASLARLAPTDLPAGAADLPDGLRPLLPGPHPAGTFLERAAGYLTDAGLAAVLDGGLPDPAHLVSAEALYLREPRTQVSLRGRATADDGGALAFTGTAQEGQLFTVDFVRMLSGAGLVLAVEGLPDGVPLPALLRLGGESRAAALARVAVDAPDPGPRRDRAAGTGRVAVVLTTPCPSAAGWRPEALPASGGVRLPDGRTLGARLVGAAVGRHLTVGGWDVAERRPKPARRAAPPGSVYFLEGVDDAPALFDALDGRSLCPHGADRAQGFGLARLGTW